MSRTAVLSDAQWALIAPRLPSSDGHSGRPFRDDRRVVEGIIHRYRCGLPWRDVPAEFGPGQTLWKRHRRYSGDGTWDQILACQGPVRSGSVTRSVTARTLADGRQQHMAPTTANNHVAHLSALFTGVAAHVESGVLPHGDPTKGVELLPLLAPQPRALNEAQVRTVKNVLDRLEGFHRLKGRHHQGGQIPPATHGHARPLRDKAIRQTSALPSRSPAGRRSRGGRRTCPEQSHSCTARLGGTALSVVS